MILGVDVPPQSKSAAIAAAGIRDGVIHATVLEHGAGVEWLGARLEALQAEFDAEVIVDPKAVASIAPEIDDLGPTEIDARELAASCEFFVDVVQRGRLRHRGERELTIALDGAAQRPLGDQWAWSRKKSGVDISPLVAVTLAVGAWRWDPRWEAAQ